MKENILKWHWMAGGAVWKHSRHQVNSAGLLRTQQRNGVHFQIPYCHNTIQNPIELLLVTLIS